MAVAAYSRWLAAGKPLSPAQPVREVVERMKAAYPKASGTFGWYANDAHYQAVPAEDHTPYSQTGWPQSSPEWWVFATDVMHRPDLGVDCNVLFAYWIAEARAGRMPWLKYLNWQGKQYRAKGYGGETVAFRTAWANSGHFDHIHLSMRTDYRLAGLGSWSITPGTPTTEEDMTPDQANLLSAMAYRMDALMAGSETVRGGDLKGETMWVVKALNEVKAAMAAPTPVTVTVDAAALQDATFLAALAKAVNDDAAARLAE